MNDEVKAAAERLLEKIQAHEESGFTVGFYRNEDLPVVERIVADLSDDTIVVTGGCIGVDAHVARAAYSRGLFVTTIMPADRSQADPEWEQWCDLYEEMPPHTTYRDRDQRIVEASDRIEAIPQYYEEHRMSKRSGTWMTVRIAQKANKSVTTTTLREDWR